MGKILVRAERCTRGAKRRTGQYRPAVTLNRAAVEFLKAMMVKVVVVVVQVVVVVVQVVGASGATACQGQNTPVLACLGIREVWVP